LGGRARVAGCLHQLARLLRERTFERCLNGKPSFELVGERDFVVAYAADIEDFDNTHPTLFNRYLREGVRLTGPTRPTASSVDSAATRSSAGSVGHAGWPRRHRPDDGLPDRVLCGAGNDLAVVDTTDRVSDNCETVRTAG
jgi:hypothetical protein